MNPYPSKSSSVSEQRVGDELYLYAANGETLTVLNGVAMLIWSLCDGQHVLDDMINVLQDIFPDVDADTLRKDVQSCLDDFQAQGLLN